MRIQTLASSVTPAIGNVAGHTRQRAVSKVVKVPFSLALIAISIVLPEELSFYIFDLRFTATRLIFILLTPVIVFRLIQKISAGGYHFVLPDLFVLLSGFWMVYAPANVVDLAAALNHGGPIALEFCVGYFSTRVLLSEHGQALKFMSLFCSLIAIAGMLAIFDTVTSSNVTHDLAGALTGYRKFSGGDARFGFLRASGPFEHPILLGMLASVGLTIACYVSIASRKFSIAGCAVGLLLALSSAPIQSFLMGIGLLTYNRVLSGISVRWVALIGICSATLGAVWLSGHSVLHFLVAYLIYDPGSGYFRIWTWTMVTAAVAQSPLFGIGFGPFPEYLEINHSWDALWLVLAASYGLPGAIFVGLSLIGGAALPVSSSRMDLSPEEKKLGVALGVVITLIIFMSFTVDFWGSSWIATALLLGVKAHISELGRVRRLQLPAR
jgi:hypothetical protein